MTKKMKKLCSYILVSIICFSLFCMTGCGFDSVNTDEEIYSALIDATEKLFDYDGNITIKTKIIDWNNGSETSNIQFTYSINPSKKIMYYSLDFEKADCNVKVFNEDGKPYLKVELEVQQGSSAQKNEEYKSFQMEEDAKLLTSFSSYTLFTQQSLDDILQEYTYSFSETKAAYESVYAEQLAERLKTDKTAQAEYKMKTGKTITSIYLEDYSKIVKTTDELSLKGAGLDTLIKKSKITGKNGKISKVFAQRESFFAKNSQTTNTVHKKTTIEMNINYSFDQIGYNKIETTLPEYGVEEITFEKNYKMKFNVGGVTLEKTTSSIYFNTDIAFRSLKSDISVSGSTIAWYEDEAYTRPFDPKNYSFDEFNKIDCVYGKISATDTFVVFGTDYEIKDERSDAYKAVFGPLSSKNFNNEGFTSEQLLATSSKTITLPLPIQEGPYQSFINGNPYDASSNTFKVRRGKVYIIQHVKSITNDHYSIFDFVF